MYVRIRSIGDRIIKMFFKLVHIKNGLVNIYIYRIGS